MSFGALLLALHVLGTSVWVGGMFFALAVLRPGMAFLDHPQRLALHQQVLRRFLFVLWHVMPVMLATGIAMTYLFYDGFGSAPAPVLVMTATGLGMAAMLVAIALGPWRELRRSLAQEDMAAADSALQRIRQLITASLALGVLTTVVAMLDD